MVRKKVRTGFLLFKKKKKKIKGKEKGKNSNLTFQKINHMVWQKVIARSLLLKKQTNKQTNTL